MKCRNVSSVLVLINWKYLSIPFILLDVKMAHDDFSISEDYYTPVTCFLTFNFCAVLGNLIPNLLTFVSILFYFLIYVYKYTRFKTSWTFLQPPFSFLCSHRLVGYLFQRCYDFYSCHISYFAIIAPPELKDYGLRWYIGIMPSGWVTLFLDSPEDMCRLWP